MFRRTKDRSSTNATPTRSAPIEDPLECIELLEDTIAADAAKGSATITPDQDSLDKSCAGRCLCLCQCHYPPEEAATVQTKKTKSGIIGTIRRKLVSIRKKDYDTDHPSLSPSPKTRARSVDRVLTSHSRTLPRSWKAVHADGGVAMKLDLPADDNCATTSRVSCGSHKSVRDDRLRCATFSPLKPRRSETVDKPVVKITRHSKAKGVAELLNDDESKKLLIHDTGYGHASAPVIATGDLLLVDVCNASSDEQDNSSLACTLDSPQTVPPVPPVYDQVKEPSNGWSLTKELFKLPKYGWYWGPISRAEAEEKLNSQPDGSFLLRDSSDERYLLSLSFRSYGRTLHTRIEHCNGLFSFYAQTESEGYSSIVDLIEHSMNDSQSGVFCYSRARTPGSPSFPVRLAKPISRFTQVRSLQYLCRFVIRQYTRVDYIQRLPLPSSIKGWLEETQY